jgi:hypothetical protein
LAAVIFVSFDDLPFLDLLAGSGVMRAERDSGGCAALIGHISRDIAGHHGRPGCITNVLSAALIRQIFFCFVGRGRSRLPDLVQANGFRARHRR